MFKRIMQEKIPGQISLTDYLSGIQSKELHNITNVLCKGSTVYFIDKGSIIPYEIYGIYDIEEVETLILFSSDPTVPPFRNVPYSDLGKTVFSNKIDAELELVKQLADDNCIKVDDMNVISYKVYRTSHKNGTPLTAFYAVLDNGFVYMKDYFDCGHLMKITAEEAKKMLQEQIHSYTYTAKPSSTLPKLYNMYKTEPGSPWEYAAICCPLTSVV